MNDHKQGSESAGGAIILRASQNVAVSTCQILDPHYRGVHLQDASRCTVSNNTIADRRVPTRMHAAIEMSGAGQGNVVQGNMIDQGTVGAIVYDEAQGKVLGNTVWE